jgi:branched-chain amino acid transport system ATP-binding protein
VAEINRRGTTVLLIEQNAETALSIAHRGVILVKGRVVASGKASELLDNDAVRHLYL